MLMPARKEGAPVRIGHDVVLTVGEVRGNQVRIGVDAPRSVQVHRAEVYDQVVEQNRTAVQSFDRSAEILRTQVPPKSP